MEGGNINGHVSKVMYIIHNFLRKAGQWITGADILKGLIEVKDDMIFNKYR